MKSYDDFEIALIFSFAAVAGIIFIGTLIAMLIC